MKTYPFPPRLLGLSLRVRDLEAMRAFYGRVLGLEGEGVLRPPGGGFYLELVHDPQAPLRPVGSLGLYHFALLLPDRKALAGVALRLLEARAHFEGASDHGVSEALYFRDPEGNGLELYRDQPQEAWPPRMFTRALDLKALLQEAQGAHPLPEGTRLGHIHLHVESLKEAEAFFAGRLGMAVTERGYPGALFFAWDGYHHHVGANTWAHFLPPPKATGLLGYALLDPLGREETLLDPTGAQVVLTKGAGAP